jgi:hypothetical protein
MRLHGLFGAAAIALTAAVSISAQSGTVERKEKTTIEVKNGKDVTVNGCLQRSSGSTDYVLTTERGDIKYAVVTDHDLDKYVDRRVEVKGKAADRGDGKVKIERKVEGTSGDKAAVKVERDGDATLLPYLGLKSIRSLASSCRY